MRAYALLFGTLATLALAYLAQVAVVSSGVQSESGREVTDPSPLWYGGILGVLTISADGSGGPAIAMLRELPESRTTQCRDPGLKYRRTSTPDRRGRLGVAM